MVHPLPRPINQSYVIYEEPKTVVYPLKLHKPDSPKTSGSPNSPGSPSSPGFQNMGDYGRFYEDALTDDELVDFFGSPVSKKSVKVDDIENITVQILSHLQSIADRRNRSDIEAAVAPVNIKQDPFSAKRDSLLQKSTTSRFRPFRKDTNFYDQEDPDQVIHTRNVAQNILSALGKVLFGYEFSDSQQDGRSDEQMEQVLRDDRSFWNGGLKLSYTTALQGRMNTAFDQAEELLKFRQIFTNEVYYYRLTLYATVIVSVVGKLLSQRVMTMLGISAASITLIFMFTQYETNSIRLKRLASDLQRSVEAAESEACRNRVTVNQLVPLNPIKNPKDIH